MFGPESPLFGLSERLPPSNLQAEQALLGAVLSNNRALYLCEGLEVEHFADPIHGRIFEQARKLADAGRLADPVTLKAAFEHAGVLEDVGGTRYLTQLLSAMILINNAGDYARVIRDCWVRRQLIDIGSAAVNLAVGADSEVDGDAAVNATLEQLLALGGRSAAAQGDFAGAVDAAAAMAEAAHDGKHSPGLETGIRSLDRLWEGLHPGELNILGARSMHGTRALGTQIAESVARVLPVGEQVQIFSLKMARNWRCGCWRVLRASLRTSCGWAAWTASVQQACCSRGVTCARCRW